MIVVDSSTVIALARSGQICLLTVVGLDVVVPEVVWAETVESGRRSGHRDADIVHGALEALRRVPSRAEGDAGVLEVALGEDALVCDDIALGRRAAGLGVRWLRTGDFVLLLRRMGRIEEGRARSAILALREAGRLEPRMAADYLRELA